VAFGRVSRTGSRQTGHVGRGSRPFSCEVNQLLEHEPQFVCRQSRKVMGSKRRSVQIYGPGGISVRALGGVSERGLPTYRAC
jgi:hypothetical protein